MSVRPIIFPITSIEPIRQALGSRDPSLVSRIREAYIRREEERYREDELDEEALAQDEFADEQEPWEIDEEELRDLTRQAKAFVNGKFTRNREPGIWRQVIVYLAYALGLTASKDSFFGDWKTDAWSEYLGRVSGSLPDAPRKSLKDLVEGRSLSGREIDQDGCSYAWLISSEVSELHAALRELPEGLLKTSDEDWLSDFHRGFVECLSACEGKCLFLAG